MPLTGASTAEDEVTSWDAAPLLVQMHSKTYCVLSELTLSELIFLRLIPSQRIVHICVAFLHLRVLIVD